MTAGYILKKRRVIGISRPMYRKPGKSWSPWQTVGHYRDEDGAVLEGQRLSQRNVFDWAVFYRGQIVWRVD